MKSALELKRNLTTTCTALVTLAMIGGCINLSGFNSDTKEVPDEKKIEKSEVVVKKEVAGLNRATAEKYADNLLLGMRDGDYVRFRKNLQGNVKDGITKERFGLMMEKFKKEKGIYKSREYMGSLKKGLFKIFVWKLQFDNSNQSDKNLEVDTLFRILMGELDDKYYIIGFSFD